MEMKTVKKIDALQKLEKKTNVAAYARVSTGKDAMLHSLSSQVSYYNQKIRSHSDWLLVGIYTDEATSGTKDNRADFNRMIEDCKNGKIDLIITKSISRFARNTMTLLQIVRELRAINVDIYFEEQNLHSLSGECDMVLTFLASFAQEESRSVSDNMKWRIKKNFEEGVPWGVYLYGYKFENNKMVVIPEEAKVVKQIYSLFLDGMSINSIKNKLNEEGKRTKRKNKWRCASIKIILMNYSYTGNLLLQKTYKNNFIDKVKMINNGEFPKYLVEDSHEAIISIETYNDTQEELINRHKQYSHYGAKETNPFTKKIVCGNCGSYYRRKKVHEKFIWMCGKKADEGKTACGQNEVPEAIIYELVNRTLNLDYFDDRLFDEKIKKIVVLENKAITVVMKDGEEKIYSFILPSRKDSWTPEMREVARQRTLLQFGKVMN